MWAFIALRGQIHELTQPQGMPHAWYSYGEGRDGGGGGYGGGGGGY